MIHIGNVTTQDGTAQTAEIDVYPDHCPVCHSAIEPIKLGASHYHTADKRLELLFRCPRRKCQSLFISRYVPHYGMYGSGLRLSGSHPFEPYDCEYPEHVSKISPQFCEIANQAQKAEGKGWKLIAGPGYRKALEFLVKDYLCQANPASVDEIKNLQLGPCIVKYVDNEKVKQMAARAAWLGNDETHYVRKWDDKDLEDLKQLIALTAHWIEMEAMTANVLVQMPQGKK